KLLVGRHAALGRLSIRGARAWLALDSPSAGAAASCVAHDLRSLHLRNGRGSGGPYTARGAQRARPAHAERGQAHEDVHPERVERRMSLMARRRLHPFGACLAVLVDELTL